MRKCKCIKDYSSAFGTLLYKKGNVYDYIVVGRTDSFGDYSYHVYYYTQGGSGHLLFYKYDPIGRMKMDDYFIDVSLYRDESINVILDETD